MLKLIRSDGEFIARSFSFGPIKRIFIGKRFFKLSNRAQWAVLFHERAHGENHHTEWRIFFLIFLPFSLKWLCHRQELAADKYAAEAGHAKGMLEVLETEHDGGFFYPSNAMRRGHLKMYDQSSNCPREGLLSTGLT